MNSLCLENEMTKTFNCHVCYISFVRTFAIRLMDFTLHDYAPVYFLKF